MSSAMELTKDRISWPRITLDNHDDGSYAYDSEADEEDKDNNKFMVEFRYRGRSVFVPRDDVVREGPTIEVSDT